MKHWPTITIHDQSLGVPALPATLDRLVRIAVCLRRENREQEYIDLLKNDSFFAVWLAAQACQRGVAIVSESDLAGWLKEDGEQTLAELDPEPTDALIQPDLEASAAYILSLIHI